jgi:pimeloyl-ACP methyl ester carboxylesterase
MVQQSSKGVSTPWPAQLNILQFWFRGLETSRSVLAGGVVLSLLVASGAQASLSCLDQARGSSNTRQSIFSAKAVRNLDPRAEAKSIDWRDDRAWLTEMKRLSADGVVASRFDRELDTRIYFTATGLPDRSGALPLVDERARAVFVFFHGSGTAQSSGRNFKDNMNQLAQLGYASVSFDYPFHMDGSTRDQMRRVDRFMGMVDQLISRIRAGQPDRPVFLVGHSFGPDVIAEYLMRYPFRVNGGALLSPAGFDPVLEKWYEQKTSRMRFGGDVAESRLGGEWAGQMSEQFQWTRTGGQFDPTVVNPALQVRVLSGDREEYVPAPLGPKGLPSGPNTYDVSSAIRRHLSRAVVTVEPGIGHYLFNHVDSTGQNVVMREILALVGESARDIKGQAHRRSQEMQRNWIDEMWQRYATNGLFRSWADKTVGPREFANAIARRDENLLKSLEARYSLERDQRMAELRQLALRVADRSPGFAARYAGPLADIRAGRKADSSILLALADELNSGRSSSH